VKPFLIAVVVVGTITPAALSAQSTPVPPPARPTVSPGHAGHDGPAPATATQAQDHSAHETRVQTPLPAFIPPITDADREAAFPDVQGHTVHDNAVNYFVLADQFEWLSGGSDSAANWDAKGWIGRDRDRLWFRSEGEGSRTDIEHAEAQVFYGRAIARWWDLLAGVRQDVRPGPSRTWAAIGLQGLAPYWFEIEATAYIGESGRTHFRFETEYDLLLTNRLILQPLVELELYGKGDPERGIGAGLSKADIGIRARYEIRREFAPYLGVTWDRRFFGTADLARAAGKKVNDTRLAIGVRLWL